MNAGAYAEKTANCRPEPADTKWELEPRRVVTGCASKGQRPGLLLESNSCDSVACRSPPNRLSSERVSVPADGTFRVDWVPHGGSGTSMHQCHISSITSPGCRRTSMSSVEH